MAGVYTACCRIRICNAGEREKFHAFVRQNCVQPFFESDHVILSIYDGWPGVIGYLQSNRVAFDDLTESKHWEPVDGQCAEWKSRDLVAA